MINKSLSLLFFGLSALLMLSGCSPVNPPVSGEKESFYATKTVYSPQQEASSYQATPTGFTPIFTELVARHGSRTMSSAKDATLSLQVWQKAKDSGALTDLGQKYGAELQRVADASSKIGYGNLTTLGGNEQRDLAARLAARMGPLFTAAANDGRQVSVLNSGKDRAVDSSVIFADRLKALVPGLKVDAPVKNPDLLYFHKVDANKAYQDYLKNDIRLNETISRIEGQTKTHEMACAALLKLFTPAFVDDLTAGKYTFTSDDTTLKNEVDVARSLYAVYSSTPALKSDGSFDFSPYLSDDAAQWFAYLSDVEDFYQKGPSFADRDITYRMAQILKDDFFSALTDAASGKGNQAARLRFTHAEIVIPFAALMQLPGREQAVAAGSDYTYANNVWRGAKVSPMAANIQWDAYKNAGGQVIVRMLYNERETRFKASCNSLTAVSFYYDLQELRRCYGVS